MQLVDIIYMINNLQICIIENNFNKNNKQFNNFYVTHW